MTKPHLATLIAQVQAAGVFLVLQDDKVIVDAPDEFFVTELFAQLRDRKSEVLRFLAAPTTATATNEPAALPADSENHSAKPLALSVWDIEYIDPIRNELLGATHRDPTPEECLGNSGALVGHGHGPNACTRCHSTSWSLWSLGDGRARRDCAACGLTRRGDGFVNWEAWQARNASRRPAT